MADNRILLNQDRIIGFAPPFSGIAGVLPEVCRCQVYGRIKAFKSRPGRPMTAKSAALNQHPAAIAWRQKPLSDAARPLKQ